MDSWVLIPMAAIIMWGVQGVVRALRGVPDPRYVHRRGRGRGLVVGGLVDGDDSREPGRLDGSARTELEELRQRMDELELLQHRVAELEERQDFTERMLTRGSHDAERGG